MAMSSRPEREYFEGFAGTRVGLTYSPLFWLTLNVNVLMALTKHASSHARSSGHASLRVSRVVMESLIQAGTDQKTRMGS